MIDGRKLHQNGCTMTTPGPRFRFSGFWVAGDGNEGVITANFREDRFVYLSSSEVAVVA